MDLSGPHSSDQGRGIDNTKVYGVPYIEESFTRSLKCPLCKSKPVFGC